MTKKITLLLLLVSMMIPMTLSAQQVKKDASGDTKILKENSLLKKNVTASANQLMRKFPTSILGLPRAPKATPSADAIIWDFESADQFDEWTAVDYDGDGYNWNYHNNAGLESGRMTAHEGDGLVYSASYDNDNGVLYPDNWMISPEVTLGGTISLWACGQDEDWCDEVFGVFVSVGNSTDPADFVQVGTDKTTTGEMTEYIFDLSQYAGQTGRFAIRHYNVSDMFLLNVDDVCLDVNAVFIPDPTDPTNVTVDPAATTADVAWDGAEGDSWNLRYKVYNPNEAQSTLWDLTIENYQSQVANWGIWDVDGDGENWGLAYSDFDPTGTLGEQENVCFYSTSYSDAGSALTPDNWLFSPELTLGGTFKFWAKNDNYPDVLGVFVQTDEGTVQIGEDITPPTDWTEYTFDTSEFAGQTGNIIIRHYNCQDQWRIYVDYLSYELPGDEPAEWIEVNGLTDPYYTIEGLEPGTDYVVEVQAYNESGVTTDWSEPTYFTTLEEINIALDEGSRSNSDIISEYDGETCNVTLTRSIVPGTWNTLCLPFDLNENLLKEKFGDDVQVKELASTVMEDDVLYFNFIDARSIDAGKPYLIQVSEAVTSPILFEDVTISNLRSPFVFDLAIFIPVWDVTTLDNGNENVLFLGANNTLYYPNADSGDMRGFRAYFVVTGIAQGAKAMMSFDDSITGVKAIESESQQDSRAYDLQGRMVSNPTKGVYILNGKKVIIK